MKLYSPLLLVLSLLNINLLYAGNPAKVQQFINHKDWSFTENKGQLASPNPEKGTDGYDFHPEIKYYGHQGGVYLYCRPGMLSFVFTKTEADENISEATGAASASLYETGASGLNPSKYKTLKPDKITSSRADMVLVGCNSNATVVASEQQEYYENYYLAYTPEEGITHVHTYKTITYKNIYPHIDMVLHAKNNGMKYEFVVYPGGNVSDIKIQWNGLDNMKMAGNGGISYALALGTMDESAPISYQGDEHIQSSFEKTYNRIGFKVKGYDKGKALVIDPSLVWATYFGGSDYDFATGISVDNTGNVDVGGVAVSSGLATSGAFKTSFIGYQNCIIAQFSNSGSTLKWCTYYGGSSDVLNGLTTDYLGNIYVAGATTQNVGIATSGAYKTSNPGDPSVFIAKFTASGTRSWGTYYGGSLYETPNSISYTNDSNIVISGYTSSTSGIATSGAYQTSYNTSSAITYNDFIAKFSTNGNFLWGSYFGGFNNYKGGLENYVTTDTANNIYLAGSTIVSTGIATSGAFQSSYVGNKFATNAPTNAYLVKFSSSGHRLWATYFGGMNGEQTSGLSIDLAGNVVIAGTSSSSGLASSGAFQTKNNGSSDLFIAKFSLSGKRQWSTYYGTNTADLGNGISIEKSGNIIVAGSYGGGSSGFPITSNAFQKTGAQSFLIEFSPFGNLFWASYIGYVDNPITTTIDSANNLYIAGTSTSSSVNTSTSGAYQTKSGGEYDLYIAKLMYHPNDAGISSIISPGSKFCQTKSPVTVTLSNFGNNELDSVKINWSIDNALKSQYNWKGKIQTDSTIVITIDTVNLASGTHEIKVWSSSPNSKSDSFSSNDSSIFSFTVNAEPTPNAGGNQSICNGSSITLGSSGTTGISYLWSSKPSTYSTTNSYYSPTLTQTTWVYLKETNSFGCTSTDSALITVNPLPSATVISNTTICPGTSISIGAAGVKKSNYTWATIPSSTFNSTSSNPVVSPASATSYSLTQTDSNGCKDSNTVKISLFQKPTASFTTNNSDQCYSTNSFAFTDKSTISSGFISSWAWSFGDGKSSTSQNPSHSYTSAGTYSVKLVVTTNNGCKDSTTGSVTVYPQSSIGYTINNSAACLTGNSFSFTDISTISSGSIASWAWDFGDSKTSSSQNPSHSYAAAGTYKIKLTTTTNNGCTDTISKYVVVYPQTAVAFSVNNSSQCYTGNSFSFTDKSTISSGSISSWAWSFGDVAKSTSQNPSHSYTSAGTYSVKLVVTTNNGCKDSTTGSVTVYPQSSIGYTISNSAECLTGNSFSFTDISTVSSGSIASWAWDFGDSKTASSQNPAHSYTAAGTYKIKLTTTTNNGCTDTVSKHVVVYPQSTAAFSVNNKNQCLASNNFSFTDKTTIATGSISSWAWDFGDTKSSTSQNPSHTYLAAGTYTVKLQVTSNNGCTDTVSAIVTVYPLPSASFSINSPGQCKSGNNFNFSDHSTVSSGSISSWAWDFGDGSTSSSQNTNHTYSAPGTYWVKLQVTSNNGCTDTVSKSVIVYPQPSAYFSINQAVQCQDGNSFSFTDGSSVSTGSLSAWRWDFGDNGNAATQNATHSYTTPASYKVLLTVTSDKGCTDTVTKTVTINAMPVANAGTSSTICDGGSAGIGSIAVAGNVYLWGSKPAGYSSSTSNPTVNPSATTIYYLTETISSSGCNRTDSVTVTVNPLPAAVSGANRSICLAGSTTIGSSSIAGHTYNWTSYPAGFVSSTSNPSVNPVVNTTYKLTETISATGCSKTDSLTVHVNPLPVANTGPNTGICPGTGLLIGADSVAGDSYSWISSPSGFSSSLSKPSITPSSSEIYILTETIRATGCAKTDSVTINVDTACKGYLTVEMDSAINTFDTLRVDVRIHNAKNIYSLYSRLQINPYIFKLVSSAPGGFLGTNIIATPAIENKGYIDFGITKSGAQPGTIGDGLFYTFYLVVKDSFPTTDITSYFTEDSIIAYNNTGSHINIYDSASKSVKVHSRVFVWPGDLNNDHKVDVADILPIGYFYNTSGPKRSGASLSWAAQPAPFWGYDKSSKNKKGWAVFADADGNGTVGLADQAAIGLNLSKSHSKRFIYTPTQLPASNSNDPTLSAVFADTLIPATSLPKTVTIPINLGSAAVPVKNLNGIAFNLLFNPAYIDASSVKFDYTGSLFGSASSDFIKQEDIQVSDGRISLGITRFNDAPLNGYGTVANLTFTTPASAPAGYFKLSALIIQATDSNGNNINVNSSADSVKIGLNTGFAEMNDKNIYDLKVFPNPFGSATSIEYTIAKPSRVTISIYDLNGKQVGIVEDKNEQTGSYSIEINAAKYKLTPGVYLLKFITENGIFSRQVVKL